MRGNTLVESLGLGRCLKEPIFVVFCAFLNGVFADLFTLIDNQILQFVIYQF